MPARRNLEARPDEYLADDGTWPEGPLEDGAPDEAEFVMEISRRLKNACKGRSKGRSRRSVARDAGMDPQTVINIIKGATWCEVPTIYRLEKALQIHLWSRRHVPPSLRARPEPRDG